MKKLRQIAEAATQGPWYHWGNATIGSTPDYVKNENTELVECYVWSEQENCIENAEHIAAFNPQTVLAMLDVSEAADRVSNSYNAHSYHKSLAVIDGVCPKQNYETKRAKLRELVGE